MNIPESPYQRLVDVIDHILVKNETCQNGMLYIHVAEVPSLPQNALGARMLIDILKNLSQKNLLPAFEDRMVADVYIPKLDKAMEKKLLAERQALFEKNKASEPRGEIALKDYKVAFDDDKATIMVGRLKCPLPPFKNEHFFCRAMFQYPANEPVDWSLVFKEMTGSYEEVPAENKIRSVRDTMYALNNRIKEVLNTPDSLFTWENKTIRRSY